MNAGSLLLGLLATSPLQAPGPSVPAQVDDGSVPTAASPWADRALEPAVQAARLLGRKPDALEEEVFAASEAPLALTLAAPAFQYH